MHPWTTVADFAVAGGTLALAVGTAATAWQTRLLVQNGQQPVLVPDTRAGVLAHYNFAPGGPPGGSSTYSLPVRNVGSGVAVIAYRLAAWLVDTNDALSFSYPGSVIISPAEAAVIELHGSHNPVPVFTIRLRYSDARGKRHSETQIPYASTGKVDDPHHIDVVPLNPTFRPG